jgi:hypothetical protein
MTAEILTIDGSQGEGGGQVLCSSLAVAGDGPACRDREDPRRTKKTGPDAATLDGRASRSGGRRRRNGRGGIGLLRRNSTRARPVSDAVLRRLAKKLEDPDLTEAHAIECSVS